MRPSTVLSFLCVVLIPLAQTALAQSPSPSSSPLDEGISFGGLSAGSGSGNGNSSRLNPPSPPRAGSFSGTGNGNLVPTAAYNSPWRVDLNGTQARVYADGRLIVTWNDYRSHTIRGDVIGLLDTAGIFDAWRRDGTAIVRNYRDTRTYYMRDKFVAIWDRNGIFDAYLVSDGTRFINNWTKVVAPPDVGYNYIALLDSDGIFDAYNDDGTAIVKNYTKTRQFWVKPKYVAILDRDGVFDAFTRPGTPVRFVNNWQKTIAWQLQWNYVALLDSDGIMQAYRLDGSQAIRQTGVVAIRSNWNTLEYQDRWGWHSFQID
jgi:hypothetical protein